MYRDPDRASSPTPEFRTVLIAVETSPEQARKPRRSGGVKSNRPPPDMAAIRLAEVDKVLDLRFDGRADRADVKPIIETAAHLCRAMSGWPDNFRGWRRKRASTFNQAEAEALIALADAEPEPWDGAAAGRILRLSEPDRLRLRISTIEPFDMSPAEREESRKLRKRGKDRARRWKAGAKDREKSAAKLKPWASMGLSRAEYYRRQAKARAAMRETVSREPLMIENLGNGGRETVSPSLAQAVASPQPSPPAGAPQARPALERAA